MSDVFAVLDRDHEQVRHMLAALDSVTADSKVSVTSRELKAMVEQLIIAESQHEAVEEQLFWPVVRDKLMDGDGLAQTAIDQETEAKHVLDRLDHMSPDNIEFVSTVRRFIAAGREHMTYEETAVWPRLRVELSEAEAAELGLKLEHARRMAPTRPHPHTPPTPGMLRTAGIAVAMADKMRDALTGRGR